MCDRCGREWSTLKLALNCPHKNNVAIPSEGSPPMVREEGPLKSANGLGPEEKLEK